MRTTWNGARPRLILVTIAWCALLFPMPHLKAADSLPAQLSNETFRTIIAEMSEPEVAFRYSSENFVSNEVYFQTVIPLLRERTKPGGVYVGVGPEQNFTYIAAIRPKLAFIIDIRRQNMLELLMYKALFEMAPERADFVALLFSKKRPAGIEEATTVDELFARYGSVPADDGLYKSNLQTIEDRLLNEHKLALSSEDIKGIGKVYSAFRDFGLEINYGSPSTRSSYTTFKALMSAGERQGQANPGVQNSFLGSEDNYRIVRSMQQKNLIVPLIGDFGGPKTIRAVGTYVRERGGIVTAFYMSNVTGYMDTSQTAAFFESVRTLPLDQSSTLIRAAGGRLGRGMERVPSGRLNGYFSSIVPIQELLDEIQLGHIRFPQDIDKISY